MKNPEKYLEHTRYTLPGEGILRIAEGIEEPILKNLNLFVREIPHMNVGSDFDRIFRHRTAEQILEDGTKVTVDKDFKITIKRKAMDTNSASALMPESVDRSIKIQDDMFIKNVKTISDYHKNVGFNKGTLAAIKKKLQNIF